jgi:hypothetical protein
MPSLPPLGLDGVKWNIHYGKNALSSSFSFLLPSFVTHTRRPLFLPLSLSYSNRPNGTAAAATATRSVRMREMVCLEINDSLCCPWVGWKERSVDLARERCVLRLRTALNFCVEGSGVASRSFRGLFGFFLRCDWLIDRRELPLFWLFWLMSEGFEKFSDENLWQFVRHEL